MTIRHLSPDAFRPETEGSYVACLVAAAPLRTADDHRSEMVSHVLFGQVGLATRRTAEWVKIRLCDDGYEGYVSSKQVVPVTLYEARAMYGWSGRVGTPLATVDMNGHAMTVPAGAHLPVEMACIAVAPSYQHPRPCQTTTP